MLTCITHIVTIITLRLFPLHLQVYFELLKLISQMFVMIYQYIHVNF